MSETATRGEVRFVGGPAFIAKRLESIAFGKKRKGRGGPSDAAVLQQAAWYVRRYVLGEGASDAVENWKALRSQWEASRRDARRAPVEVYRLIAAGDDLAKGVGAGSCVQPHSRLTAAIAGGGDLGCEALGVSRTTGPALGGCPSEVERERPAASTTSSDAWQPGRSYCREEPGLRACSNLALDAPTRHGRAAYLESPAVQEGGS